MIAMTVINPIQLNWKLNFIGKFLCLPLMNKDQTIRH